MINFFKLYKLILQILFLNIFLSTNLLCVEKILKANFVSNYFSGIVALKDNKFEESYNYLRKLENLENQHLNYSKVLFESQIQNFKINEAYKFAQKLKRKNQNFFQSDLVIVSKLIKNKNFIKANDIIVLNQNNNLTPLQNLINQILFSWTKIEKSKLSFSEANQIFNSLDSRYKNINKINNVFLNCYYDTENTEKVFQNLTSDRETDFSRYTFFYVNYLLKKNLIKKANLVLNNKLNEVPQNLLLNQTKINIFQENQNYLQNNFNCKNISHIIAELFYLTANALSSQSLYSLSNFYLNLSKYLNQDFFSYNTLLAENFVMIENYGDAERIFNLLKKSGEIYNWHSSKQIALIQIEKKNVKRAINDLEKSYNRLNNPDVFQTYDFANFLKNNERYEDSIKFYSKVIKNISSNHELYPKAKDGRGIAYERTGKWKKAEKDFLESLNSKPNQAYVINYLAYSWIEKGIKIEKSLEMLEEANRLKSNDGYITDSLGWALFKLKRYDKAKEYLQKAVQLMPSDPIVNDHYADTLWMTGEKIQARYYWNYVLNLKDTEEEKKNKIKNKILNGPIL